MPICRERERERPRRSLPAPELEELLPSKRVVAAVAASSIRLVCSSFFFCSSIAWRVSGASSRKHRPRILG